MNAIEKLAKVSAGFIDHIEGRELKKNEWMPCPRCGEGKVEPPSGSLTGGIAGASMVGCWLFMVFVIASVVAIIYLPAGIVIGIIGAVMIPVIPAIGVAMGASYKCKSCNFTWTFKDVQSYLESQSG